MLLICCKENGQKNKPSHREIACIKVSNPTLFGAGKIARLNQELAESA